MSIIIAIDNGLKGGLVVIDSNKSIVRCWDMPVIPESNEISMVKLYEYLTTFVKAHIVVEKIVPMPGMPSNSLSVAGINHGKIIGMINSIQLTGNLDFSLSFVSPITWSKYLHKGVSCKADTTTKAKTELALLQRYGQLPLNFYNRNNKFKDGVGDALGIAIWYLETQVKG